MDHVCSRTHRSEPFLDAWARVGIEAAAAVDATELRDALERDER
jgi:hypothetical protein